LQEDRIKDLKRQIEDLEGQTKGRDEQLKVKNAQIEKLNENIHELTETMRAQLYIYRHCLVNTNRYQNMPRKKPWWQFW
jgi:peptidoglycan hydrolase CwlO-like protein